MATRLDTGDMDNEPKNEEKGKRSGVELNELKEKSPKHGGTSIQNTKVAMVTQCPKVI